MGAPPGPTYSLDEFAQRTGVSRERIRHWIRARMMPYAHSDGGWPRYGEDHVERALAIQALRKQKKNSRAIGEMIAGWSRDDTRAFLGLPRLAAPKPNPTHANANETEVAAFLCAAAEDLDVSPRGLRAPLAKILRRLAKSGMSASAVADALEKSAEG